MKLALVIGHTGQLARELGALAPPDGWRVELVGRAEADLYRPETLRRAVAARRPDAVINAAAYTAVDKAESEPTLAWAANAEAPRVLAKVASDAGAAFAHVSTDYVFDGTKTDPWTELDPIGPLSVYGASKAAGEIGVLAENPRNVVLRTSWIYAAHGRNFVKTMLALAAERDALDVVDDQIGRPTAAKDLAQTLLALAVRLTRPDAATGVVHFSNAGEPVTWRGFAEAIFDIAGPRLPRRPAVRAITTAERPAPARRPANSVLALDRLKNDFGVAPRDWRAALAETLDVLLETEPAAMARAKR